MLAAHVHNSSPCHRYDALLRPLTKQQTAMRYRYMGNYKGTRAAHLPMSYQTKAISAPEMHAADAI
jgi:hypothetical protein